MRVPPLPQPLKGASDGIGGNLPDGLGDDKGGYWYDSFVIFAAGGGSRQLPPSGRSRPVSLRQSRETQPSRPAAASLALARHSSITWGGVSR